MVFGCGGNGAVGDTENHLRATVDMFLRAYGMHGQPPNDA